MQNRKKKKKTHLYNSLLDSVGEGDGGMFQENSIETCILSRVRQITSPGWNKAFSNHMKSHGRPACRGHTIEPLFSHLTLKSSIFPSFFIHAEVCWWIVTTKKFIFEAYRLLCCKNFHRGWFQAADRTWLNGQEKKDAHSQLSFASTIWLQKMGPATSNW